jgi:Putative zinc-finger
MAGKDPLVSGGICDRAREWASLRLDDELSPLEGELLDRHLEVCHACRMFEDDMRWAADVIRLTPQERPVRRVTPPVSPRRRVSGRRLTAVAAAAALSAGALIGSVLERSSSEAPADGPTEVSFLTRDANQLRDLPRTRILAPLPTDPDGPPSPPEGVI